MRFTGFAASFLFGVTTVALANEPVKYFCPRSAVFLVFEEAAREMNEKTDAGKNGSLKDLRAGISECRKRGFNCSNVDQEATDESRIRYQLVLPKTLKHHQQYVLNDMRLVTRWASLARPDKHHPIVVTVWQQIEGAESAMELTFERGRGLVYIDGIRTRQSQHGLGEMCVLEGDVGLFPNVRIR